MKLKKKLIFIFIIILITGCTNNNFFKKNINKEKHNQYIIWKKKNKINNIKEKYYITYFQNRIYINNKKGKIESIDVNSGKKIWAINLLKKKNKINIYEEKVSFNKILISKKLFYLTTDNGKIIALNTKNGKIKWEKNVHGNISAKPIIKDQFLIIYTNNGILQAINATSGKNIWKINLQYKKISIIGKPKPVLNYGILFVFDDYNTMYGILLKYGEILWKKYIDFKKNNFDEKENFNNIRNTPIIDCELKNIYINNHYGEFIAINIFSKKIIWKNKYFTTIKNITVSNKNIYIIDKKDQIFSIKKKNGKIKWSQKKYNNKKLNFTKPILYENKMLLGDKYGYINFFNIKNGNFIKRVKIDNSEIINLLKIKKDKILIQTKKGNIYLIKYL